MNKKIIQENFVHILKMLSPLMPHLAAESLEQLKIENRNEWPKPIEKYLKDDHIEIIVQINGKKRMSINAKVDIIEEELITSIKNTEYYNKNYANKKIVKTIFVKNRLINLIIK